MHDDEQVGRLFELSKDVMAGQLPPRLAQDLGFGFDYPFFNFYPSFVYYVAEIFHLFGFSFITSTKLMIGLGFILAGIFMYLFAKEYFGRAGGVVSAIAYSYTPYHSMDVYVRGALPEFWSFVFVPAIFWSAYKLAQTRRHLYILVSALFIACLILTHDLVAMMSSFFLGAYFIYLLITSKEKRKLFIELCVSFLLGLGFSAFFWLPGYFEKQYTMVYLLTQQSADYHRYFVCIRQFINSPWGYGASVPGCSDGLSFQVGQAQLALAFISLAISSFFVWKKRKGYGIAVLFVVLFLFSLFIQTKYSLSIWNRIPQFAYIQFPWRFLIFSDFTIAFLTAFIFSFLKNRNIQIISAVVMVAVLIILNKGSFVPENYLTSVTDANYTALSVIRWHTSQLSFEYTPIGIATKQLSPLSTVIAITPKEIPINSFVVIRGKMTVTQLQDIPQQKVLRVSVSQPGQLRFNTYIFPGWKTYIDDKEVPYTANNKLRLITVELPAGQHTVRATFTDTPLRAAANGITLASIIGVIVYLLLKKKSNKKK